MLKERKDQRLIYVIIELSSSGIGKELALRYAEPRVRLILVARDTARLKAVKKECEARGASAEFKSLDLSKSEDVRAYMTEVDQRQNIDLIIANAGRTMAPLQDGQNFSDAAVDLYNVNVMGVFTSIAPVVDGMSRRGHGQVAIVSSLSGVFSHPDLAFYGSSKAALNSFCRHFRPKLAAKGVHLNCVVPGFIQTPMTDDLNQGSIILRMRMITVDAAVKKIIKGLANDKSFISFPASMYWPMYMASSLPPPIQAILTNIAAKMTLSDTQS
ncbi:hypothetical protein DFS34DRAFT_593525 [Phlyctochytrium arcticum]|nr:hypothetical protein DFS34DRAFT_593525 [Phlyctochytrium arcticum]